jgi:hypothetical protein
MREEPRHTAQFGSDRPHLRPPTTTPAPPDRTRAREPRTTRSGARVGSRRGKRTRTRLTYNECYHGVRCATATKDQKNTLTHAATHKDNQNHIAHNSRLRPLASQSRRQMSRRRIYCTTQQPPPPAAALSRGSISLSSSDILFVCGVSPWILDAQSIPGASVVCRKPGYAFELV